MLKETLEEKTYRLFTKAAVDVGIRLEAIPPIHMCTGTPSFVVLTDVLVLAIAEEREACAKLCDDLHYSWRFGDDELHTSGPRECANAIRNRSKL